MPDFFVSYTHADEAWAEWIGYVLEEKGFSVTLQAWDFKPGSNFVLEMQRAATTANRTLMVLSQDYLQSPFASSEWAAAFSEDPIGINLKLVPVMVRACQPEGLLKSIVQIRIVGLDESSARQKLLAGVDKIRAKPSKKPPYPGGIQTVGQKKFPGPSPSEESGAQRNETSYSSKFSFLNNSKVKQGSGSSININISQLEEKLRKQPWWVKLALLFTALIFFLAIYELVDNFITKESRFVASVESSIDKNRDQYVSSFNAMVNTIPNNIISENGPQQWQAISRIWARAAKVFEETYSDAANCIESRRCSAVKNSDACKRAVLLNKAYNRNLSMLSDVKGVIINRAIGNPIAPFGDGVVDVPQLTNLPLVASHC